MFRPLAASVLQSEASKWFDMLGMKQSPHMTFSFECIADKKKIPSVVHVDGSCRIQTVNKDNKYFYDIIKKFFKKTNIPMLLNTSFNIAGDPMVESPKDAIDTLNKSKLKKRSIVYGNLEDNSKPLLHNFKNLKISLLNLPRFTNLGKNSF